MNASNLPIDTAPQHSPGPWTLARLLPDLVNIRGTNGNPVPAVGGIANCYEGTVSYANALLVTASPELLQALENLVALSLDPAGSTFTLREVFGTFHCTEQIEGKRALSAIGKARGLQE